MFNYHFIFISLFFTSSVTFYANTHTHTHDIVKQLNVRRVILLLCNVIVMAHVGKNFECKRKAPLNKTKKNHQIHASHIAAYIIQVLHLNKVNMWCENEVEQF